MVAALNGLNSDIIGIKCDGSANGRRVYIKVDSNCDAVAAALNELNSDIIGIQCYRPEHYNNNNLVVNPEEQCPATARALSILIADKVETNAFRMFFKISLPITGLVFGGSGYYAYNHLGGDDNLPATFSFALFVCFRVFDLMSD